MFKASVGKRSLSVKNTVERGAVKKFAEAIGDPHPIFVDAEVGRKSRYRVNIAPPTFPTTFDYGVIEGLNLSNKGLIHGSQTYKYKRPLRVGEEILCYTQVKNYYARQGKLGEMGFLVLENVGTELDGTEIFTSQANIIVSEVVGKQVKQS
jgi:acyl dehydratase